MSAAEIIASVTVVLAVLALIFGPIAFWEIRDARRARRRFIAETEALQRLILEDTRRRPRPRLRLIQGGRE